MFPKDYSYDVEYLAKLWISQGFILSKDNKTAEKIGFEYALQLYQRSLFERNMGNMLTFKLHDIVHDLAQLNSENGCYSIDVGKVPIFPNVLYHLYIARSVNLLDLIPFDKLSAMRTLNFDFSVEIFPSTFDLSMAPKLRVLEIKNCYPHLLLKNCDFLSTVGNLKHLHYLSLTYLSIQTLSECICSLYSLQNLTLKRNHNLKELPTKIGNLISLEELIIDWCSDLMLLPESLCQLKALRKLCVTRCQLKVLPIDMWSTTNLETLKIEHTGLSYLPPSLSKFVGIQSLRVEVKCETIGWLKDFPDWGGALYLYNLKNISNLIDVQCANLVSMSNLKKLILCWDRWSWGGDLGKEGCVFQLIIDSGESEDESEHNRFLEEQHYFSVMISLQPHPNLTKLEIEGYGGNAFPDWIGSLCKLKHLRFSLCKSLQFLGVGSLPLELEELEIVECHELVSISGMQKLKSLVKVSIHNCKKLGSVLGPSLELSMSAWEGSHGCSSLGLTNLADEWHPLEPCKVDVFACPGLEQWCLQHGIINWDIAQQWMQDFLFSMEKMIKSFEEDD